jgi:hypothetical protein
MSAIRDAAEHEHAEDWSCCVDLTWHMQVPGQPSLRQQAMDAHPAGKGRTP